jgi:hypothetical protein
VTSDLDNLVCRWHTGKRAGHGCIPLGLGAEAAGDVDEYDYDLDATLEGLRRGFGALDAGRVRSPEEFVAEGMEDGLTPYVPRLTEIDPAHAHLAAIASSAIRSLATTPDHHVSPRVTGGVPANPERAGLPAPKVGR